MSMATLTTKSQVTMPREVRESLGIGPGDQIRFVPSLNGFRIVAVRGDISRVKGMFKGRRATPLSIEDMNASIAQAAVQRFKRAAA
jgi:antitoxin PrlF